MITHKQLSLIRDNAETAEIPQFLGIFQEHDQKRVGGDGKDALQQKGFEHGIEQVFAWPAGKGMEMCHKRDRDMTEPICQKIDPSLASMTIFDTSGIEAWVTENNPKYANRIIKQLKAFKLPGRSLG